MCLPPFDDLNRQTEIADAVDDDEDDDDILDIYLKTAGPPCSDFPRSAQRGAQKSKTGGAPSRGSSGDFPPRFVGRAQSNKSVCFSGTVAVVRISTVEEMAVEEKEAMWYTPDEYKHLKKDAKYTVRYIHLLREKKTEETMASERLLCSRGLEHMLSPSVMRERRSAKEALMDAVLGEHRGSRRSSDDREQDADADAERIAAISRMLSEGARRWATERGASDAREARGETTVLRAAAAADAQQQQIEVVTEDFARLGNFGTMDGEDNKARAEDLCQNGGIENMTISRQNIQRSNDLSKAMAIVNAASLRECEDGIVSVPARNNAPNNDRSSRSQVVSLDNECRRSSIRSAHAATTAFAQATQREGTNDDSTVLLRSALSLLARNR